MSEDCRSNCCSNSPSGPKTEASCGNLLVSYNRSSSSFIFIHLKITYPICAPSDSDWRCASLKGLCMMSTSPKSVQNADQSTHAGRPFKAAHCSKPYRWSSSFDRKSDASTPYFVLQCMNTMNPLVCNFEWANAAIIPWAFSIVSEIPLCLLMIALINNCKPWESHNTRKTWEKRGSIDTIWCRRRMSKYPWPNYSSDISPPHKLE